VTAIRHRINIYRVRVTIRELLERIEDEHFDIKFDEFEELVKFGLFTSKEASSIRVRSLQISFLTDASRPPCSPSSTQLPILTNLIAG
jgi:hypothetical protein